MMAFRSAFTFTLAVFASALAPTSEAGAEMVLSQLVVDLRPGKQSRQDIEVTNSGADVLYVAVEPREVLGAGTSHTSDRQDPDPEKLGLLVSPTRLILDPGERKLLRVAAITGGLDRERVYRVTIKPVVGQLSSDSGGLKILVGYDVLVLLRPATANAQITGSRSGNELTLHNTGNISVELTGGFQCDSLSKRCDPLPGGRLYAGATKTLEIDPRRPAKFVLKAADKLIPAEY